MNKILFVILALLISAVTYIAIIYPVGKNFEPIGPGAIESR